MQSAILIRLPENYEIFYVALVMAMYAYVAAFVLSLRLRKYAPELYRVVDSPLFGEWWPFWVFNFLAPAKWRLLPSNLRLNAMTAMAALGIALAMMLFIVFRFAASGGSL